LAGSRRRWDQPQRTTLTAAYSAGADLLVLAQYSIPVEGQKSVY